MTHTVTDNDDDASRAAAEALGNPTKAPAVGQAQVDAASRRQRLALLDDLDALAADLSDPEVMRGAWTHRAAVG